MNKRIVTITMIKNESDIVELFIRYTASFATEMVFIDNGCVDGSISIINAMQDEGYNISVYNEADVYYEQFRLENKYINKYADRNFDLIIPLDVDEFLACDTNLEDELGAISEDFISIIKWRTFCLNERENQTSNLFERCSLLRVNETEKNIFTKVLIPTDFYRKNDTLVSMGHHDVIDEEKKQVNEKIYVAHFPVRSIEQIRLKIYQGIIAQLMSSYRHVIAFHWKRIFDEMNAGSLDVLKYSKEYALYDEDKGMVKFEYAPFIRSKENLYDEKYERYKNTDISQILFLNSQVNAIRQIVRENVSSEKKSILVYGTGNTAEQTLLMTDLSHYEIIAFIDSDRNKCMTQFKGKLVISPSFIKHITFGILVIASIYEDEIREILSREHIAQEKIVYFKDFIRYLCR